MGAIQSKTDFHSLLVVSCLMFDFIQLITVIKNFIENYRKKYCDTSSQTDLMSSNCNITINPMINVGRLRYFILLRHL